ncbi:hypothetical protein EV193_110218 [Herbihabitans rhizosphaerae]|uniref:Uncharacterized protein n=1 Tax=Herbihabitans rhizosphaerae TaxID=1872711 RepID=A0A4Q7KGS2_9PSEU|nr:hypothetical protein [Herbihabitans rhizosphaerae]RZS34068.1 hypothetical protein EV193_110218 [Herbihabitans rhizosphaerae]
MPEQRGQANIIVDDVGVKRTLADGNEESVAWDELAEVAIRTTPDGPWDEDVFFLLIRTGGGGCAVPAGHPAADKLMSRLQTLPGFDNDAFVEAMTTTADGLFVCWQREG